MQRLLVIFELFQCLQLVCGQDLRSFVSKTYVRLWNTLAYASGGDLYLELRALGLGFREAHTLRMAGNFDLSFLISHLAQRTYLMELSFGVPLVLL